MKKTIGYGSRFVKRELSRDEKRSFLGEISFVVFKAARGAVLLGVWPKKRGMPPVG